MQIRNNATHASVADIVMSMNSDVFLGSAATGVAGRSDVN